MWNAAGIWAAILVENSIPIDRTGTASIITRLIYQNMYLKIKSISYIIWTPFPRHLLGRISEV